MILLKAWSEKREDLSIGYFNIKNREVLVAYENVQNLAGEREKTANEKTFGKIS